MKSSIVKTSLLSLGTALLLSLTACGGGGGDSTEVPVGVTTYSGGAIDGYLQGATVFVDSIANEIHDSSEQNVTTDTNGDFTLSGPIDDGTKVFGYGGIDLSTGLPFEGRLSTIFRADQPTILSPLTTYVTALVDRNISIEDATLLVATNLGINPADVNTDPMELPSVFLAAQKVQKTVEVIAVATGEDDFNTAYESVFASLADMTENNTSGGDFNASALVDQVQIDGADINTTVADAVSTFLDTYTATVDEMIAEDVSVGDLDTYGELLNTYTEVVEGLLEDDSSLTEDIVADIEETLVVLDDLNITEVVTDVEDGTFTDPYIEALGEVTSALDNNISYLGANSADDNIVTDLNLTDPTVAPFDTDDLNLTWSTNNSAISSSGVISRSDTVDIDVELKATVKNTLVTSSKTFDLVVKRVEYDPVASDKNVTIVEDNNITVDLSGSITDQNGDLPTVTAVSSATSGTAVLNAGVVSYVPNANFNGSDSFTYTVTDDTGRTATATVNVTVTPVDDATVWSTASNAIPEQVEDFGTVSLELNATDVDGTVTYSLESVTAGVNADINGSTLTVDSVLNANGVQEIVVTANEGGIDTNLTLSFNVIAVDDAPVWQTSSTQPDLDEDFGATSLELNATDVEGSVTYALVGKTANIDANVTGSTLYLTSIENANGLATIVVNAIQDGVSTPLSIDITINAVNDAPVADSNDQLLSVKKSNVLTGQLSASDVDGDTLTYLNGVVTAGVLELNADGSFSFTAPDVNTTVTLTFDVSDGNLSDSGTQTITVTLSDAPVGVDDIAVVNEDEVVSIDVLANDTDDNNATLTITSISMPANGQASLVDGNISYSPDLNFNGSDSFTYTIVDPDGGVGSATVNVTVNPLNDLPEVADTAITMMVGETISGVANIVDVDDDNLSFSGAYTGSVTADITPDGLYSITGNTLGSGSMTVTVNDGTASVDYIISVNVIENTIPVSDDVPEGLSDGGEITSAEFDVLSVYTPTTNLNGTKLYALQDSDDGNSTDVGFILFNSDLTFEDTMGSVGYTHDNNWSGVIGVYDANDTKVVSAKLLDVVALYVDNNFTNYQVSEYGMMYKVAVRMERESYWLYDDMNATDENGVEYTSLTEMIDNNATGIITRSNYNPNRYLVFAPQSSLADGNGTVLEVDVTDYNTTGEVFVVSTNAATWSSGTYDDGSDMVKVVVTAQGYDNLVLVENSARVQLGGYDPAGSAFIEYRFNEIAAVDLYNAMYPVTQTEWIDSVQSIYDVNLSAAEFDALIPNSYDGLPGSGLVASIEFDPETLVRKKTYFAFYTDQFSMNVWYEDGRDVYESLPWTTVDYRYNEIMTTTSYEMGTVTDPYGDLYAVKFVEELNENNITALTGLQVSEGSRMYKMAYKVLRDHMAFTAEVASVYQADGTVSDTNLTTINDFITAGQLQNGKALLSRNDEVNTYVIAFADGSDESNVSGALWEINLATGDTNTSAGTWGIVTVDTNKTALIVTPAHPDYPQDLAYAIADYNGQDGFLHVGSVQASGSAGYTYVADGYTTSPHIELNFANMSVVNPVPTEPLVSTDAVGVWKISGSAVTSDFDYLVLLDNGEFLLAEKDSSADPLQYENGLEVGTYTFDGSTAVMTIAYDQNGYDENGTWVTNSGIGDIGSPVTFGITVDTNTLTIHGDGGDYVFSKVDVSSGSEMGVWRRGNALSDFSYLVITGDGEFIYAENDPTADEQQFENGLEAGTYVGNSDGSVSLTITYDDNGYDNTGVWVTNSGIGDLGDTATFPVTITTDELTIHGPDGDFSWTRAL